MKPQNFIIPLVVYPFDVMVSVDETDEQLWATLKSYCVTYEQAADLWELSETARGRAVLLPTNQTVIRIFRKGDSTTIAGTIAHEMFHAVTFIMHLIGVQFEVGKSDESYAYLIDYLTREIYKKVKL